MVKKIGLGLIMLIALLLAYNLVNQIYDAVKSGERLSQQLEEVYQLEAQNRQLKKRLSEIQSDDFLEEQARNKLGFGKTGETVIIIPEEKIRQILGATASAQEARLPNWLGWLKVFWH